MRTIGAPGHSECEPHEPTEGPIDPPRTYVVFCLISAILMKVSLLRIFENVIRRR
jgi:hypothetical protein